MYSQNSMGGGLRSGMMGFGASMALPSGITSSVIYNGGGGAGLEEGLGVGGVGLDIPEAEAIIVLAPWWNPKRIDQAIARLTRDDRHESITAYILVMKDSLEEGVLEIGERKRAMIQTVLDGGDSDETGALTEEDLALLFQPRG